VSCDGEAIVLDATFKSQIATKFEAECIDVGKHPASCSGIHQASDVAPLFKSVKKRLKTICEHEIDVSNPVLERNVRSAIRAMEEEMEIVIPSEKKNKIAHAALAMVSAVQHVMRPTMITSGFSDSGQYPLNFNRIMTSTYRNISDSELRAIYVNTDRDVALFRTQGYLTEEQLDASNIPAIDDRQRDTMPIHNQRAVLITNPNVRSRHLHQQNRGLPLGSSIVDAPTKSAKTQLKKAAALVSREQNAEAKRTAESQRKAQLSIEELEAEKAAKKQKTKERQAEKAAALAEARELLSSLCNLSP
jgi:hypothetical protein